MLSLKRKRIRIIKTIQLIKIKYKAMIYNKNNKVSDNK